MIMQKSKPSPAALALCIVLTCASGPDTARASAPQLQDAAGNYGITGASRVHFSVAQVGGGGIVGDFGKFSGNFRIDGSNISRSSVEFTLYPESVETGESRVEDFLKSSAVFDSATYRTVTFRSTSVTQTGPDSAAIEGTLTARGKTRKERFSVKLTDWNSRSISFMIRGSIFRSPYGMDVGTPIYSNVVEFDMNIKGQKH
ncbi:polyisoprenoid-binding protein [Sinorhizobium sp. A49]|jgi:polyisoprenoid-binding protein YceI|uniref:YceI family protein n=1 Tax=Sinorhizobium sp. A49 TaxID=1945861 RepID=UPI000984B15C|nr:YceI family protein [Sinorhizobium sp. A49]OOG75735.1 polyisoprenoid-binding protein [Sinorhizobium sp. A49]